MSATDMTSPISLKEWANRKAPGNQKLQVIVETLSQKNSIVDDLVWEEANNGLSHVITQRTYEPQPSERMINLGVPVTSSRTKQVSEISSAMEDYSEIDEKLYDLFPDKNQGRFDEDVAHLAGFRKTMAQRLFYGAGYNGQIKGLANRFNAIDNVSVFDNSEGNGSVTANKTSLWILQWGKKTVNCFFPQNTSDLGIKMKNNGRVQIRKTDGDGVERVHYVYQTQFDLNLGLAIHDTRAVMRLANISTSNIDGVDDFSVNEDLLIDMLTYLEYTEGVKTAIYCNRVVMSQLRKTFKDRININHDLKDPLGLPVLDLDGIPIRRVDQITNTEGLIS